MFEGVKKKIKSITQATGPDRKTVLVFVPSYPGPKVHTMESLLTMTQSLHLFRPDLQCRLDLTGGAYLPLMRNIALRQLWETPKAIGLLMVDHDAVFPTIIPASEDGTVVRGFNPLDRLISLDKDIVGGLFTTRNMPIKLMCGGFDPATGGLTWLDDVAKGHPLNNKPFEVDWIGCHFLYISRHAAVKMAEYIGSEKTLFDCQSRLMIDGRYSGQLDLALEEFKSGTIDRAALKEKIALLVDHAGFFQEDVSFCRRAKAAGCEIWVDPMFEVQHIGDYSYGRMDWIACKQMEEAREKGGSGISPQAEDAMQNLPEIPHLEAVK